MMRNTSTRNPRQAGLCARGDLPRHSARTWGNRHRVALAHEPGRLAEQPGRCAADRRAHDDPLTRSRLVALAPSGLKKERYAGRASGTNRVQTASPNNMQGRPTSTDVSAGQPPQGLPHGAREERSTTFLPIASRAAPGHRAVGLRQADGIPHVPSVQDRWLPSVGTITTVKRVIRRAWGKKA